MKLRPEILTHPNIPKPLHGRTPREILGKNWWDGKRQEAYVKNDYRCWACGVHKEEAKYHNWLEAHEYYDIDYVKGIATLKEITSLCHMCHNFIHSGRMYVLCQKGEFPKEKMLDILKHGFKILKDNDLKPFYGTYLIYLTEFRNFTQFDALSYLAKQGMYCSAEDEPAVAKWQDWRLIIDGVEYKGKFKSELEWQKHYSRRI